MQCLIVSTVLAVLPSKATCTSQATGTAPPPALQYKQSCFAGLSTNTLFLSELLQTLVNPSPSTLQTQADVLDWQGSATRPCTPPDVSALISRICSSLFGFCE